MPPTKPRASGSNEKDIPKFNIRFKPRVEK
jgi:hypothetical protein